MIKNDNNADPCCKRWKVENLSLIYGIISVILTGGGIIILIGFLIYAAVTARDDFDTVLSTIVTHPLYILAPMVIVLLFSGLLVYGIYKKKPIVVLACLIFGIIETLVFLPGSLLLICDVDALGGSIALFLSILYLLPLLAVIMTYRKLRKDEEYHMCGQEMLET